MMGDHFSDLADKDDAKKSPNGIYTMQAFSSPGGNLRCCFEYTLCELSMTFVLAPDSVPMAEDVEKVLGKKGVREALTDPQIQRLLGLLREDPVKAQRYIY